MAQPQKVVLAYSGGLDTSVIAKWLSVERGLEVVTVDAKGDGPTQVSQIQDLITQDIDALIYIPAGAAAASGQSRI